MGTHASAISVEKSIEPVNKPVGEFRVSKIDGIRDTRKRSCGQRPSLRMRKKQIQVCARMCVHECVCVWTVCTNFSSSCSTRRNLQRDDRWCNGSSQHPRRFFDPPLAEPGPFKLIIRGGTRVERSPGKKCARLSRRIGSYTPRERGRGS